MNEQDVAIEAARKSDGRYGKINHEYDDGFDAGVIAGYKSAKAAEPAVDTVKLASSLDGRILKDSYRNAKNFNLICQCGHKNGRHWYLKLDRATDKSITASWDCRDCECPRFKKEQK